jgi:NAD(P)-dependent dehydrogenase (short-subunit alcohol dehydrogenase family)
VPAGGLGAPTVARLRERGARVVGLDRVPGEHILACDVTDDAEVETAVAEAVERLGGSTPSCTTRVSGSPTTPARRCTPTPTA